MKKINIQIRKILLRNSLYICLVIIALIYALICIKIPRKSIYDLNDYNFSGIIFNYKIDGDKLSIDIDSKEDLKCNYYFKSENEKKGFSNIKLGSKINITGKLNEPKNNTIPNTFNYKKYLYYHNIFYTCTIESLNIDTTNINIFYKIKNKIIGKIMDSKNSSYLLTFIIGDKSLLDDDVMNSYRENGVTHLFAISGMHIGLFSLILLTILKKIKVGENKRYIITIMFIWFYAFLTGFPSSVLRAGLLFTLLTLNKIFYTEVSTLNILLLVASMLIIYNPFILMDIGFIYSYCTTFGLVYAGDVIKKHKIIGTSLIAFMSSLPITICNFYSVNILSIIFNLFFVPFVSTIVYPLCLLTFIFNFLDPVLETILNIMEYISIYLSNITAFKMILPKMNVLFIIIYYIVFLLLVRKKYKLCVISLLIIIFVNNYMFIFDNNIHVAFLDVSQGDSIILRNKKNVIIIDTGGKVGTKVEEWKKKREYKVSDNTITYLNSLGIFHIQTLIITHGDADHMGEAINLVNNLKVDKVIFNCGLYNDLEKELIKVLDKKKIKYYPCIKELNIDNNKLYFLQTKEYDNENDNSNVIYTELNGYKFMFMGDAGVEKEKDILKKYNLSDIDVLKVGHHGSKTSSGKVFINEINPKYSIISVGKNNRYGHPNKVVLNNLENSKIYRTDEDGSIIFKIKNNKLKIDTCSP